jgi:hypothetical protein
VDHDTNVAMNGYKELINEGGKIKLSYTVKTLEIMKVHEKHLNSGNVYYHCVKNLYSYIKM